MKKYIGTKYYDTNTAKLLAEKDTVKIYRKATGEYFLYSKIDDNSKGKIIPLDFDEAKNWAKEKLDSKTYDNLFGVIVQSTDKRLISLYISTSAHEMAKLKAAENKMSISKYIEHLIINDN